MNKETVKETIKETETAETETKKETVKETASYMLKAVDELTSYIVNLKTAIKTKNDRLNELAWYCLQLKKKYNRNDQFLTVLIKNKITELKPYFESVGLFFSYSVKSDFIKVIVDSDGAFIKTDTVSSLLTYKEYLQEKRKETEKNKNFNESLKRLFKDKNKDFIKDILKTYQESLKA